MEYKRFPCPDRRIQGLIDRLKKIDPAVKKQWVDALLSGDYQQTNGRLHTDDGFCCLGVVTDLAVKAGKVQSWTQDGNGDYGIAREVALLPNPVYRWLTPDIPPYGDLMVYYKGQKRGLSSLNDDGVSFEMIAGLIINQL